ncbi:MAG: hypothetical protein AVDCRST_MAG32-1050, partial [uncultured Nocardioides sp.]
VELRGGACVLHLSPPRRRDARPAGAAAASVGDALHGRPLGRRGGRTRGARRDCLRCGPARGGRGARHHRRGPVLRVHDAAHPGRRADRRARRLLLHRTLLGRGATHHRASQVRGAALVLRGRPTPPGRAARGVRPEPTRMRPALPVPRIRQL